MRARFCIYIFLGILRRYTENLPVVLNESGVHGGRVDKLQGPHDLGNRLFLTWNCSPVVLFWYRCFHPAELELDDLACRRKSLWIPCCITVTQDQVRHGRGNI